MQIQVDFKGEGPVAGAIDSGQRQSVTARALESLRQRLSEETWAAGDRLPSEPALAKEMGVSRVSVRGALAQLEAEGLLTRRHGSGTYVNSVRPLVRSLHLNIGSDELIRTRGHIPGIAEMSWRHEMADGETAGRLAIDVGDPVLHLYRVRTSDGAPVTVSHDYLSAALIPDQPLSLGPSLYAFLSTVCGIEVNFGIASLEPTVVTETLASIFGARPGELCLVVKQVDYDQAERPVSYSVEYHLSSAFDFQLVRQGPSSPGARTA
ncbi:GntR family transcriptional regulator [Paenarthrobacter sp. A20]|uniref:GntR family transcriptional regulator n=1 Tax=Paenarthrobacter sp. A20 TaxID=2817891 RepID=UPI0035A97EED